MEKCSQEHWFYQGSLKTPVIFGFTRLQNSNRKTINLEKDDLIEFNQNTNTINSWQISY